jgi:hypothetical protein
VGRRRRRLAMTVVTDIDALRRIKAARNAALVMLGVTVAGFFGDMTAWFVLTVNALIWLMMGIDKTAQVHMLKLSGPSKNDTGN